MYESQDISGCLKQKMHQCSIPSVSDQCTLFTEYKKRSQVCCQYWYMYMYVRVTMRHQTSDVSLYSVNICKS